MAGLAHKLGHWVDDECGFVRRGRRLRLPWTLSGLRLWPRIRHTVANGCESNAELASGRGGGPASSISQSRGASDRSGLPSVDDRSRTARPAKEVYLRVCEAWSWRRRTERRASSPVRIFFCASRSAGIRDCPRRARRWPRLVVASKLAQLEADMARGTSHREWAEVNHVPRSTSLSALAVGIDPGAGHHRFDPPLLFSRRASKVKGKKPGPGTDDGSRGTGTAPQPAPHLGDPDQQRADL
jgi:hypothetical protein